MDNPLSAIIFAIIIGIPVGIFFICLLILVIIRGLVRILSDTGKAITIPAILAGGFTLLKDRQKLERDKFDYERGKDANGPKDI